MVWSKEKQKNDIPKGCANFTAICLGSGEGTRKVCFKAFI